MRKFENTKEFKSVKEFVNEYELNDYIRLAAQRWDNDTFGKQAERIITQRIMELDNNFKVTKTTHEYDFIYGADFKVSIDNVNCYFDLKTTIQQERLKNVVFFLDKKYTFGAKYHNKLIVKTKKGICMCLGIRYKRTIPQGTIFYKKPVLVPIVFGNINAETLADEEFINDFMMMIKLGLHNLQMKGHPDKIKRSFDFLQRFNYVKK